MVLAEIFAVFFSLVSFWGYFFDFFFGNINFRLVFLVSLLITFCFFLKFRLFFFNYKYSLKRILFLFFIFLTAFIVFSGPSLFNFLPLGRSWDGANHIALANYLLNYHNHRTMVEKNYKLSHGGALFSYPWGFHINLALIAELFGIRNVFFVVYPFTVFVLALVIVSFVDFILFKNFSYQSAFLVFLILLFSYFSFFYMIKFNYWSQILGALLSLALIYFLENLKGLNFLPIFPIIVSSGIFLIYPLYLLPLIFAFAFYSHFEKKYTWPLILIIIFVPVLVVAIINFSFFSDNLTRLILRKSPSLYNLLRWDSIFVFLFSLIGFFDILKSKKENYFIFPFTFLSVALILKLLKIHDYWNFKIISFGLVLFLIGFTQIWDKKIKFIFKNYHLIIFFLVSFVIVFSLKKNSVFSLPPGLTFEMFQMRKWTASYLKPDEIVFYPPVDFINAWNEAIFPNPKITNFFKIDVDYPRPLFIKNVKYIVLNEKDGLRISPEIKFNVKHQESDLTLYEILNNNQKKEMYCIVLPKLLSY